MTRALHTTTASGDAISLQARAQAAAHGRTVAQLEHNAMQALALVRATLSALNSVARSADRASLLLSHSRGLVEAAVKPELERVFTELLGRVQTAESNGELLLRGGARAFALQDPWQETGEPLCVELPDLQVAADALTAIDLRSGANALIVGQRNAALLTEIRVAHKRLTLTAKYLVDALASQRRSDSLARAMPKRSPDDGFITMIGRVRDQVLHAGGAALRVQGAPSTRAAWLVEARELAR